MKKRMKTHLIRRKIGVAIVGSAFGFAVANASVAQPTTGHAAPKPVWPDNGIAQRMLPNASMMFVENDHGKLRAWVVSEPPGGENEEALDFFSGQKMKVKVDREDDGHQEQSFTDSEGKFHSSIGNDYEFSGTSMLTELSGINFEGMSIHIKNKVDGCYARLNSIASTHRNNSKSNNKLGKFHIYHSMSGPKECSTGSLHSEIISALDLNDGTFLAAEGCFVFRLKKSDLFPVGSAPSLRVVDEKTLNNVISHIQKNKIQNATGYLADALKLPIAPNLSCKDY